MKRLWLVMLSLGMVLAFSASAMAVDVKFSGEYYAAGMYLDKTNFIEGNYFDDSEGPSTAFYYQRLRVRTDFIVSPGLKLVTRFDALKRAWGAPRSSSSSELDYIYSEGGYWYDVSAGTTAENENIAFDWAYIEYASPIGVFTVGYQNDGAWGTVFGDSSVPRGKIGYAFQSGGWTALAQIVKIKEYSKTAKYSTADVDLDNDRYIAGVIYNWKSGEAGVRLTYDRTAEWYDYLGTLYSFQPYAKAKFGPVTVQAELNYYWGDEKEDDGSSTNKDKMEAINFFLDAVADLNMFYIGGTFAYLSGNDPNTYDKYEGGQYLTYYGATGGGIDWNPCLILWNFDRTYWAGVLDGHSPSGNGSPMHNAWFFQGRAGVKPLEALDIMASVSYAYADEKPTGFLEKDYGWEVDATATYKITNNLSYMLGVGYLFTGDYFKGTTTNDVADNFLIINKLTLTF